MFFSKAILPICELLVERFLLLITAGRKLFPRTVVAPELYGWLRAPTGQNNFRCQGHLARPSFLHLLHSKITVPDTIFLFIAASGTVVLWEALLRVLPKETSSPEEGGDPQAQRSGEESLKARTLKSAQKDEGER